MPSLVLNTNVIVDGVAASRLLQDISHAVCSITGKPEAYMMVLLKGAVPMCFAGSEEPAAYGEFVSVGELEDEVSRRLSAAIAEKLALKLSIPASRFYIKFDDQKQVASQTATCLHALHQ